MGAQRWEVKYDPSDGAGYFYPVPPTTDWFTADAEVILAADYDRDVAEAEARGWNAGLSDPAVREQIIKTLMDEGSEGGSGWHSWRCFDKSRYPGPCGCTPAVADALLAALRKPSTTERNERD